MGWHTDDFLVVCEQRDGSLARLAGQVKRSFTVSAANENCRASVLDFWNDFDSPNFSRETDRLVLVTLRGTNTLLDHFVGLLDCARAARNPTEFKHRLSTPGFISGKAVHYCEELRKIIAENTGYPVATADIWAFLRLLHVLSLDLGTSTRQTEAQIKTLLGHTVTGGKELADADDSWNRLLGVASAAITEARSLSRLDLPTELLRRHDPMGVSEQGILRSLKDHTAPILDGIRSTIGPDFQLQREVYWSGSRGRRNATFGLSIGSRQGPPQESSIQASCGAARSAQKRRHRALHGSAWTGRYL